MPLWANCGPVHPAYQVFHYWHPRLPSARLRRWRGKPRDFSRVRRTSYARSGKFGAPSRSRHPLYAHKAGPAPCAFRRPRRTVCRACLPAPPNGICGARRNTGLIKRSGSDSNRQRTLAKPLYQLSYLRPSLSPTAILAFDSRPSGRHPKCRPSWSARASVTVRHRRC